MVGHRCVVGLVHRSVLGDALVLIILEGPDGSGKSTLAREIAATTDARVIKRNEPDLPALVEYTAALADYEPGFGETVICDRWHVGERVYGPLYRGGCELSPIAWAAVEAFLAERGAVVVHCSAHLPVLVARLMARGERVDYGRLSQEADAFVRAMTWTRLPQMEAVTSREGIEVLSQRIITFAIEEEQHVANPLG